MNNVYELRTHRVDYACAVERPEPATWRDWAAVLVAYLIGLAAMACGFVIGAYVVTLVSDVVRGVL